MTVANSTSSSSSSSMSGRDANARQALPVFGVQTTNTPVDDLPVAVTSPVQRMASTTPFGMPAGVNLGLEGTVAGDVLFAALAADHVSDGSIIVALPMAAPATVVPAPALGMLGRPTNQLLFGAWGLLDEELGTIDPSSNRDGGQLSMKEGMVEQLSVPQWFDRLGNGKGGFGEEQQPEGLVEPAPVDDAIEDWFAALSEGGFAEDGLTAAAAVVGLTFLLRDRPTKERVPSNRAVSPRR